jgi:hypothetical protein
MIDQFRPHLLEAEPTWDGTFSCTSMGRQHVILHQYDRVPEWLEAVQRRYSSHGQIPGSSPGMTTL